MIRPAVGRARQPTSVSSVVLPEPLGPLKTVIPPRSNRLKPRTFDHHLYRDRNLVERFFARIKQFRRIATRYDKLALSFLSFVHLACTIVWLA